jgi:hypothetical protein
MCSPAHLFYFLLLSFGLRPKLGDLDSNQNKQNQNLLCYRYTIPQKGFAGYT